MRVLLLVGLFAVPALAQTQKSESKPRSTEIVFEGGDVIDGELSAPDLGLVRSPHGRERKPSLIRVRTNFDDKVMASAVEL